ncbi:MAG: hypothetical protein U0941_12010 [Planctomycetaceae bacterium]
MRLSSLGAAGVFGHQTIIPDGPRRGCGNWGYLEFMASSPAITAEGVRLMLVGLAPRLHLRADGQTDRISSVNRQLIAPARSSLRPQYTALAKFIQLAYSDSGGDATSLCMLS